MKVKNSRPRDLVWHRVALATNILLHAARLRVKKPPPTTLKAWMSFPGSMNFDSQGDETAQHDVYPSERAPAPENRGERVVVGVPVPDGQEHQAHSRGQRYMDGATGAYM